MIITRRKSNQINLKNQFSQVSLEGKVAIVTGSSDGIGAVTAEELLKSGATVIYACRNKQKTEEIIENLPKELQGRAVFMELKLNSFSSVGKFIANFKSRFNRLDLLINNAAVINNHKKLTEDGIEETMQVNTYSPMILTQSFLELLDKSEGRVINVSSRSHALCKVNAEEVKNKWSKEGEEFYLEDKFLYPQYFASKLGNVLFTHYLKNYIEKSNLNIKTVALHPGAIKTKIMRSHNFIHYIYYYLCVNKFGLNNFSLLQGAQTTLHCCYEKFCSLKNGGYYSSCELTNLAPHATENQKDLINEFMKFSSTVINKAGEEIGINFHYKN
jgi:NAD(P)-dependent dehydrogenase (short-subunit alcohol dehydrogenase family)